MEEDDETLPLKIFVQEPQPRGSGSTQLPFLLIQKACAPYDMGLPGLFLSKRCKEREPQDDQLSICSLGFSPVGNP